MLTLTSSAAFASAQTTPPPPPAAPVVSPPPVPPQDSRIPESVKKRQTVDDEPEAAARVDNEPLDPALLGFFMVPGTTTRFKIGGYIRGDLIHDFSPAGNIDEFIISTIPIGNVGTDANTQVHARQSRVSLDTRRPVGRGQMRALFEMDFFGSDGERVPNLRHAYAQVVNLLVGFTVSTVQDSDSRPDILDYEGPASRIAVRHAQVRYTLRLAKGQSLAVAIEEPLSDVPSSVGGETVTPRAASPDVVTRYRWDAHRGHLQSGVVLRSIGGYIGDGAVSDQVFGWGVVLSGSLLTHDRDTLVFEASGGRGFARYVKDMSGKGLDLYTNAQGQFRAAGVSGVSAGYQHFWSEHMRSTLAASIDARESVEGSSPTTYRSARYAAINLIFRSSTFTTGVEYDFGRFSVHDGQSNSASRIQVAVQYGLVK